MNNNLNRLAITFFVLALMAVTGCTKPKDDNSNTAIPGAPSVTTFNATNITAVSATIGGRVTSKGACMVLTSGVALSITPSPTIDNENYINTNPQDTGSFSFTAAPLLPNTKYYARAYAINCKGIAYGNEITFTTPLGGGGGGGGADTTIYFEVTVDGTTYYFSQDPPYITNANGVHTVGLGYDPGNGIDFSITAFSSHYPDITTTNGYSFILSCPDVNGIGTFTFTDNQGSKVAWSKRLNTGVLMVVNGNVIDYDNNQNKARLTINGNCSQTDIPNGTNTIIITEFIAGNGGIIAGTFNGTFYENLQTEASCINSEMHSYSGKFRLRIQV
ncbi:MAG: hypothetical protein KA149_00440 [Chitinophagales bacterium]|nr:hypothetical protein [Chitinophagales bacterium]